MPSDTVEIGMGCGMWEVEMGNLVEIIDRRWGMKEGKMGDGNLFEMEIRRVGEAGGTGDRRWGRGKEGEDRRGR